MFLITSNELIIVTTKYLLRTVVGSLQDGPQRHLPPGAHTCTRCDQEHLEQMAGVMECYLRDCNKIFKLLLLPSWAPAPSLCLCLCLCVSLCLSLWLSPSLCLSLFHHLLWGVPLPCCRDTRAAYGEVHMVINWSLLWTATKDLRSANTTSVSLETGPPPVRPLHKAASLAKTMSPALRQNQPVECLWIPHLRVWVR